VGLAANGIEHEKQYPLVGMNDAKHLLTESVVLSKHGRERIIEYRPLPAIV
jgi:hypothetical protein